MKAIEQRTGEARKDIRLPEKDRKGSPVELHLKIGPQEYAIEHTQIEAFEEQIGRGVVLEYLFDPIKKALSGKLPGPALYTTFFPSDRKLVVKSSTFKQQQEKLEDWVRENALRLYGELQKRIGSKSDSDILRKDQQDSITAKPCGFPYEIELHCQLLGRPFGKKSGLLGAGRMTPEELEALTTCRLRRALYEKLPKLRECKKEDSRTVLVLESDNVLLGSDAVCDELTGLQGEFTGKLPFSDEIYFIITGSGSWFVWLMECDGQRSSSQDWTRCTEFRADELTDLTA